MSNPLELIIFYSVYRPYIRSLHMGLFSECEQQQPWWAAVYLYRLVWNIRFMSNPLELVGMECILLWTIVPIIPKMLKFGGRIAKILLIRYPRWLQWQPLWFLSKDISWTIHRIEQKLVGRHQGNIMIQDNENHTLWCPRWPHGIRLYIIQMTSIKPHVRFNQAFVWSI